LSAGNARSTTITNARARSTEGLAAGVARALAVQATTHVMMAPIRTPRA